MSVESLHPILQFSPVHPAALVQKTSLDLAGGETARSSTGVLPEVSPLALLLSEEGLDFSHSTSTSSQDQLNFDLTFSRKGSEQLVVVGTYNSKTETLDLELRHRLRSRTPKHAASAHRAFATEINLSVAEVRSKSISPFISPDDILSLVRQFLVDLQSASGGAGINLSGSQLNDNELAQIETGSKGGPGRSLEKLIRLVVLLARLKEILDSGNEPPAQKELSGVPQEVQRQIENERITALSISVREVPGRTVPGPNNEATVREGSAGELEGGAFTQPGRFSPVPAALS